MTTEERLAELEKGNAVCETERTVIKAMQDKIDQRLAAIERNHWIGIGIVIAIQVLLTLK